MESPRYVAQVKHVARLSLTELERLALELEGEGRRRGKCGLVVVKRRGGRGTHHNPPDRRDGARVADPRSYLR